MTSALERRLAAEWTLLQRFAAANPQRVTDLSAGDLAIQLCLRHTPALALEDTSPPLRFDHHVRICFPLFFPAAPMELYLGSAVQHPNIHPLTGFVCLWDRHQVTHTVEHALHKLAAMLGWRLYNRITVHVMQPDALQRLESSDAATAALLAAPPLVGLFPETGPDLSSTLTTSASRRRRLS